MDIFISINDKALEKHASKVNTMTIYKPKSNPLVAIGPSISEKDTAILFIIVFTIWKLFFCKEKYK